MKRMLVATALAWGASPALADADKSQLLMIWGAGNVPCEQYLQATKQGTEVPVAFEQWLNGYITARNQTSPEVLDYAGAIDRGELLAWVSRFCQGRPRARYFEAADALLSDLAKSGRVRYAK